MKVLFIAYHFEPFSGVGAKRVSYWAKNIHSYYTDNTDFAATVITATEQINCYKEYKLDVHYVQDVGGSILSSIFKTDKGASWFKNLFFFLKKHLRENTYDVAIITGGPFLHFLVQKLLKSQGIRVILDFRDPFATNPRARKANFFLKCKRSVLKFLERYFVSNAHKIITVNKYCMELLACSKKYPEKFLIIDNGYDEKQFPEFEKKSLENGTGIKFVYAGTLFEDRNPRMFLQQISNFSNFAFYHIGAKSKFSSLFNNINVIELGLKPYSETLREIQRCDVCMIFTSGFSFESTTKIFDYIALEKMIWIITEGEIKRGAMHEITKDYPNVIWSRNNYDDIGTTLNKLTQELRLLEFPDKYFYSRGYGLKKLVEELNRI